MRVTCENCDERFSSTGLRVHIGKNKECGAYYGPRFKEMKRITKVDKIRRFRAKHGTQKELERQRAAYQANPDKRKRGSRKRAQEKKNDSNANNAKYISETAFGPEFVCICCHGGYFENQVVELNEKRRNQINSELLKNSCDPENEDFPFYDPRDEGKQFVCKNCFTTMSKKKKMPAISVKNGLTVEKLPSAQPLV